MEAVYTRERRKQWKMVQLFGIFSISLGCGIGGNNILDEEVIAKLPASPGTRAEGRFSLEQADVTSRTPKSSAITSKVLNFCEELLCRLQMDLKAEGRDENGIIYINITGNDRSYLLSNSAALLNSLEYLLNRVFPANRGKLRKKEDSSDIELDSDNYRKHRKLELELLAKMASQKVLSSRKPLTLQPMVPRERKIVHLALAETMGIESRSEGSAENRSITIYPV